MYESLGMSNGLFKWLKSWAKRKATAIEPPTKRANLKMSSSSTTASVRDLYFDLTGRVVLITGGGTGMYVAVTVHIDSETNKAYEQREDDGRGVSL